MERTSSKEYSVVFLVEGKKFNLLNLPSTTSSLLSVLLPTRSAQRLSSPYLAAVLSTTMVFAEVRTHFPKKNTRVYRNAVTCVTCVTSNRVEVHHLNSQHLAMVRTSNMAELVPSDIFCLQPWFLQRYEHIFPRKTPLSKIPI